MDLTAPAASRGAPRPPTPNLIHQSRCPSIRTSKLGIGLESWAEFAANQAKPDSDA